MRDPSALQLKQTHPASRGVFLHSPVTEQSHISPDLLLGIDGQQCSLFYRCPPFGEATPFTRQGRAWWWQRNFSI
ncbi:unnamed protein product [Bubo scandiacus]